MHTITLHDTLPAVFQNEDRGQSGVWRRDLSLSKGDRVLVEAESGSGKSSLVSFIFGQRRDYLGDILFDDTNIRTFSAGAWDNIRRTSLSVIFQELRLFPELTALDNVLIKNRLTRGGYKTRKQIDALFDELGVAHRRDALVAHMSYGQQQRVALIRALCQPFDFLIADEPISHIDDLNAATMAAIISREATERGAGVIVTSIGKHFDIGYTNVLRL